MSGGLLRWGRWWDLASPAAETHSSGTMDCHESPPRPPETSPILLDSHGQKEPVTRPGPGLLLSNRCAQDVRALELLWGEERSGDFSIPLTCLSCVQGLRVSCLLPAQRWLVPTGWLREENFSLGLYKLLAFSL